MNVHKNARLTPHGRERIVRLAQSGQTPAAIASQVGVCPRTVRKWLKRYREAGPGGLLDRSSRPHRLPPVARGEGRAYRRAATPTLAVLASAIVRCIGRSALAEPGGGTGSGAARLERDGP